MVPDIVVGMTDTNKTVLGKLQSVTSAMKEKNNWVMGNINKKGIKGEYHFH